MPLPTYPEGTPTMTFDLTQRQQDELQNLRANPSAVRSLPIPVGSALVRAGLAVLVPAAESGLKNARGSAGYKLV